uniref:Uncharacterized protein n=1 Tax=Oryza glumipatula TaxID=40148 RepID=A0A0E0BSK4_9ORYZ
MGGRFLRAGKRSRSTDERLAGLVETLKKAKLESGTPRTSPIRRPTRTVDRSTGRELPGASH